MPESLGNTEVVLPNGVVCDRCNHTVSSRLDEALIQFFPLAVQRVLKGVRSKTGKVSSVPLRNGLLSFSDPSQIELISREKSTLKMSPVLLPGGYRQFKMRITGGKRMTPRYASLLSRALLKCALECAWLDRGEEVLGEEWDHVRDAILGEDRAGYFIVLRNSDPDDNQLELQYVPLRRENGELVLAVAVRLFGFAMATDSRNPKPLPVDPEEAIVVCFGERGPARVD